MTGFRIGITHEDYKLEGGAFPVEKAREALAASSLEMACGRRDRASFQVMVQAAQDFTLAVTDAPAFSWRGSLPGVRLAVRWETQAGQPALPVEMFLEELVEDDDRLLRAETLLRDEAREVPAGFVQPVWVDVTIPEDAPAGIVRGEVVAYAHTMFGPEREIGAVAFTIQVFAVLLPAPREYSLWLGLWQHLSNIARKHEVRLWSDEHFAVLEHYTAALAALGQKTITCVVSEVPWSGQGCYQVLNYPSNFYEYNLIQIARTPAGAWRYDYSILDRYLELCMKHGICGEIEVLGLCNIWLNPDYGFGAVADDYPDAIRLRYRDEASGTYRYMDRAEDIEAYIRALEAHFVTRGWAELVRLTADEPGDEERYRASLERLRRLAPRLKLKAALNHADFIRKFAGEIEDYVPLLSCVASEWEAVQELRKTLPGRFSFYVCCAPAYPNNWIKSPLVENRLLLWLVDWSGLDGFLRWDFTAWPEHPRERAWWRWQAGDTHFVLPGRDGRPLLTLRYLALQRGVQDYELAQRVRARGPAGEQLLGEIHQRLLKIAGPADLYPPVPVPPSELYSLDHADYEWARRRMLEFLAANP